MQYRKKRNGNRTRRRNTQQEEQNNFALAEFVANKKAETSFEPVRNRVMKLHYNYNQLLIDNVKNKTHY